MWCVDCVAMCRNSQYCKILYDIFKAFAMHWMQTDPVCFNASLSGSCTAFQGASRHGIIYLSNFLSAESCTIVLHGFWWDKCTEEEDSNGLICCIVHFKQLLKPDSTLTLTKCPDSCLNEMGKTLTIFMFALKSHSPLYCIDFEKQPAIYFRATDVMIDKSLTKHLSTVLSGFPSRGFGRETQWGFLLDVQFMNTWVFTSSLPQFLEKTSCCWRGMCSRRSEQAPKMRCQGNSGKWEMGCFTIACAIHFLNSPQDARWSNAALWKCVQGTQKYSRELNQ